MQAKQPNKSIKQSQRERITKELMAISIDVTADDREAYMKDTGLSTTTVSAYLNGKQVAIETGLNMLLFFKERIAVREKKLESISV